MWLRDPEKARVRSNPRGGSLIYSTNSHNRCLVPARHMTTTAAALVGARRRRPLPPTDGSRTAVR